MSTSKPQNHINMTPALFTKCEFKILTSFEEKKKKKNRKKPLQNCPESLVVRLQATPLPQLIVLQLP